MSDEEQPAPLAPPRKSRRGCWIKVGIALLLVVGSGYYVIFHTAIPARFVIGRASEEGTFEAEGIDGSLASGKSSIGIIHYDLGAEKMSEFHGYEMKFPKFGPLQDGIFTIESIHLDRAILYLDSQNLGRPKDSKSEKGEETAKEPRRDEGGRGFRMDKLEVPEITIHVLDRGWTLPFPRGLKIHDVAASPSSSSIGGLLLDGEGIRFEIPPFQSAPEKSQPSTLSGILTFTSALDPTVLQNIEIAVALTFLHDKLDNTRITAFDGAATARTIPGSPDLWSLRVEALTVGDHIADWFPGRMLELDATYDNQSGRFASLSSGTFLLGNTLFALSTFQNQPTDTLHATAQIASTRIQLAIVFPDGFSAPLLSFTSSPELPEPEIRSLLNLPPE